MEKLVEEVLVLQEVEVEKASAPRPHFLPVIQKSPLTDLAIAQVKIY